MTDIATMLVAIGTNGASSGQTYALHCGEMSLHEYQQTLGLLKVSGLVTEANYFLTLTPKGQTIHAEIESATISQVVAQ